MPVITISHQVGSGGREIGQALAQRLGLDYIDREIVQGVAQRLGINENIAEDMDGKAQSTILRILSLIAGGPTVTMVPPDGSEMQVDERRYFQATQEVIAAACESNHAVIAGHGANFALRGKPEVLDVFIYAPREQRIATIMARDNLTHEQAAEQVHSSDHDRIHYIKTYYNCDWQHPSNYHLLINTGMLKPKLAVEIIAQAAAALNSVAATKATAG